jgi:hypothetical protein
MFYGIYEDDEREQYMVMEYLAMGDLVSLLQKKRNEIDFKTMARM